MAFDELTPRPRLAAATARLARQSDQLAEDVERYGPLKDGKTAEDYRAEAVSLRRRAQKLEFEQVLVGRRRQVIEAPKRSGSPRARQPRSRNVRTGSRRARAPSRLGDDDSEQEPPPSFDLGRLAVVAMRSWAHEQRRLARRRLAA